MRRTLLFLLLLLAAMPALAANVRFSEVSRSVTHATKPVHAFWLCDTEAGMPTTGLAEGDLAYAKDSDKLFKWDGSSWIEVGGGGGSGLDHAAVQRRVAYGGF